LHYSAVRQTSGLEWQLAIATDTLNRLPELLENPDNLGTAATVFNLLNVRVFASFEPVQAKKRVLNRLLGGVVTFGDWLPPVALYESPTARKRIKSEAAAAVAVQSGGDSPLPNPVGSGREGKLLGNVSRGDRTPIELFASGTSTVSVWPIRRKLL
jgi:hypothetical protein